MSKKTREQKIIADLRRQLAQQKSQESGARSPEKKETFVFKPQQSAPVVSTPNFPPVSTPDYIYVKRDLVRTLILTVLAISVQVVLWYVLKAR